MTTLAVIEWPNDDAEAPAVFAGTEESVVQATAVAMHNRMAGDPDYEETLADVGFPGRDGETDTFEWHRRVREAHTSPWVTFYDLTDGVCVPHRLLNMQLLYPLEVTP